jgi:uncharacterized membrane protein
MFHHSPAHIANILLHVLGGTLSLGLGLVAILSPKGLRLHRRAGRLFMYSYAVVVVTAIIGIFVFEFRSFLLVVTILSLYDVFAGYRALQLRGRRPQPLDTAVSAIAFCTPWIFLAAMHYLRQPWSPVLTWSILGGLILVTAYDLARNFLPLRWLQKVWVQEHLYKMMSAYIAITSAFAGTVFSNLMPWAAVLPSAVGFAVIIGFFIAGPKAWKRSPKPPAKPAKLVLDSAK